ncbi:hypothetical protein [Myxococcus xanthus]|uniref:HK97 gp10 family phage protein n=1 Tax=Myxococcus xanthus TaxID=34 RepID=A0A7Y4MUR0_MYXXA|nr:hypothetical protein [Myxococcus xanthus]NOJ83441.1 hypothetical protein [Myxococcus xanthus]NOJ86681.1 hypothetical protein [Myxococcus xanthus]
MPVRVRLDANKIAALRRNSRQVLRKLDAPIHAAMRQTLDFSSFLVPRSPPWERAMAEEAARDAGEQLPPPLADSGFISGPEYNLGRPLSTSWTAGYEHPEAGPIHEGFHWGAQIVNPPPHFLKKAFRRSRGVARKGVAQVLAACLKQHFSR